MTRRNRWLGAGLALVLLGCSSSGGAPEATGASRSAIESGSVDATDSFAVAVVQQSSQLVFCSGVLLAPNLVATARHCVSTLASPQIECGTSSFGPTMPAGDLAVSTVTQIGPRSSFVGVSSVVVPTGPNQNKVCGNDIALLILDRSIALPQYVEPVISPPMTDHTLYSTQVAVIGYGLSTPTDEAGITAGIRRIKQDVSLACIPNDPTFTNCFASNAVARSVLAPSEFVSGDDSTCEGDSGSGAFDQASFNQGRWVAFGVLSRGGVSSDGLTCVQPIYSRFDAWGPLLAKAALQAAAVGGYAAPTWASSLVASLGDASASEAGSDASLVAPAGLGNGVACAADSDCVSNNCVSTDNVTFTCASPCNGAACAAGFSCRAGYCFADGPSSPGGAPSGGCAMSAASRTEDSAGGVLVGGIIALAVARSRRRQGAGG